MSGPARTPAIAWRAGFQFEFYCELCKTPWRPSYQVDVVRETASWVDLAVPASSPLSAIVTAANFGALASTEARRPEAFRRTCAETARHFTECPGCLSIVCPNCVVPQAGLCRWCVDQQRVVPAAGQRPQPLYELYRPPLAPAGPTPPARPQAAPCTGCGAPYAGTPFCGHCGHRF